VTTTFREDACTRLRLHPGSTPEQIEYAFAEHLADLARLADTTMRGRGRRNITDWLQLDPGSDDDQILASIRARLNPVSALDQQGASSKMHELVTARAAEKKIRYAVALGEIGEEHRALAERALPTPVRPSSMSHNRNEPGDPGRVPAPARPATALGVAEAKIREHAALTGQTDRTDIIRDLLMSGLPVEVKDALRRLLAQENPRAALAELTEQRMAEKQLSYMDAALAISREQPELVERARP
jgi:hypothetical protein